MKNMSVDLDQSLGNLIQSFKDNIRALEAAKAEIVYLKKQCDAAHLLIKNAYVASNGEIFSLDELCKRFADWEYRFTDDHR